MPTPDRARYRNVVRAITATPWAILPETFDVIAEVVTMRLEGRRFEASEVQERISAGPGSREPFTSAGSVAVIPITGVIVPRASLMTEISGGTSMADFGRAIDAAAADPSIGSILLDVDSPGGSSTGVLEAGDKIRAATEAKPVVAVANGMTASAAYWLASQASELVASPSSLLGSIGVLAAHEDWSGADEQMGIQVTYVTAGRYKVEGHHHAPLDDEARGELQRLVDEVYGDFVSAVARGRGVSAATVRSDFGEGRVLTAKRARAAGMADRIDTFDGTLARLLRGRRGGGSPGRAAAFDDDVALDEGLADVAPTQTAGQDAPDQQDGPESPTSERDRALLARMHRELTETTTRLKEA